jgi:hypothetical protein
MHYNISARSLPCNKSAGPSAANKVERAPALAVDSRTTGTRWHNKQATGSYNQLLWITFRTRSAVCDHW